MRLVLLLTLGAWACEVDAEDGQFLCPDGDCPPGQRCNSAGVCVDELDGFAGTDAGEGDVGVDAPVDASSDVFDSAVDVFDAGNPESCDPDSNGFSLDENGDGSFDEGCPFEFGVEHPVTDVHVSFSGHHFSPELSADGLTLYVAHSATPGGGVYKASRADLTAPFGPAELFFDAPADSVTVFTEDEFYIQRGGAIIPVIEGTEQEPLVVETTTPADGAFHPSISRDGLDLWVSAEVDGNRDIWLSRRGNLASSFVTWTSVFAGPGSDQFPRVSHDRLRVIFQRDGGLVFATRDMPTTTFFTTPMEFAGLPAGAVQPFYHPPTREMFFVRMSSPPWAPAGTSIWRVQACRDSMGCAEDPLACESEVTSSDGFHCYSLSEAATTYDEIACGAGFAATLHSDEEIGVLERLRGMMPPDELVWLGGQRVMGTDQWDNGEPFLFTELGAPDANGCFGLRVDAPRWSTIGCTEMHRAFCETQMWPTWVRP